MSCPSSVSLASLCLFFICRCMAGVSLGTVLIGKAERPDPESGPSEGPRVRGSVRLRPSEKINHRSVRGMVRGRVRGTEEDPVGEGPRHLVERDPGTRGEIRGIRLKETAIGQFWSRKARFRALPRYNKVLGFRDMLF